MDSFLSCYIFLTTGLFFLCHFADNRFFFNEHCIPYIETAVNFYKLHSQVQNDGYEF